MAAATMFTGLAMYSTSKHHGDDQDLAKNGQRGDEQCGDEAET